MKVVAATSVWSPVASRLLGSMIGGDFTPQFPIARIAKDFGFTLAEAGEPASAPTIAAALGVFREAIAKGLGEINMTGVVKLFAA
jgi:3-hydroxyisobutyrate dehydrogenase-like beta-hydroxyacid dehydrogenase